MKFLIAKKDGIKCRGCPGFIERGDEMVQTFMPMKGILIPLCYHVQCYIPWYTGMFNRKWNEWKKGEGSNPPPLKRGRPVKYQRPTREIMLNRLRALLSYHRRLGHEARVKMLEDKVGKVLHITK